MQPSDAEQEAVALAKVVNTFKQYRRFSLSANQRRRKDFHGLPIDHQRLLSDLGWKEKLSHVDSAIERNADFLEGLVVFYPFPILLAVLISSIQWF